MTLPVRDPQMLNHVDIANVEAEPRDERRRQTLPFLDPATRKRAENELRRLGKPEEASREVVAEAICILLNDIETTFVEPGFYLDIYGHPFLPATQSTRLGPYFTVGAARQAALEYYAVGDDIEPGPINAALMIRLFIMLEYYYLDACLHDEYRPTFRPNAARDNQERVSRVKALKGYE